MDLIVNATQATIPQRSELLSEEGHFYHQLLASLYEADDPHPVADLLRRYYGLKGRWLVASPMRWQASHNDAVITADANRLGLSWKAAEIAFSAFSEFAQDAGMDTYFCEPSTWLIRCDDKPSLHAPPLHKLFGQSLLPHLEALDAALYWQRFITESQMFFNTQRFMKAKSSEVNGVWLWGDGVLPALSSKPIICMDEAAERLAGLLSSDVRSYEASQSFPRNAIVLMLMFNADGLKQLKKLLKHQSINWYWNNIAYATKPRRKLSRLWSFIRHAD